MSHVKRALFPGVHDGELLVHEVVPGELTKVASGLAPKAADFIGCLKPDPRYTYVLVNAMGYSEFYGANSNKDWYGHNSFLDFNGLLNAWPDIGSNIEADRMKGRAWPYGYPSFYNATAFAHHKNTDPQQLGFGDVIYVDVNPLMKRVELVMRVFNDEALKKGHTSILSRIRAGERVDVSMGCKVPFDLCSICTDWDAVKTAWKGFDPKKHRHPGVAILAYHKFVKPIQGLAITKDDYCEHMIGLGGQILPDGRKVFVFNDFPRFFDISFVWIGADRTARVMWHMAEGELPKTVAMQSAGAGALSRLIEHLRQRQARSYMPKVAAIEKQIPDGVAQAVHSDADSMPELSQTHIKVVTNDPKRALSTLAALGIVLTPAEFQKMVLGDKLFGGQLNKVSFDTDVSDIDDTFAVSGGAFDEKLAFAMAPLMAERSAFSPFLGPRLGSPCKTAAQVGRPPVRNVVMDKLAAQYNGYRLSVLEQAPELFPNAGAFVGPDVYLQDKTAGLGAGVAGLLLGLGPMIHLLSSHLRRRREAGQQLGTMATLIADKPTFTSVATLGTALRAAMKIDKAGGLVQAAKNVARVATKVM